MSTFFIRITIKGLSTGFNEICCSIQGYWSTLARSLRSYCLCHTILASLSTKKQFRRWGKPGGCDYIHNSLLGSQLKECLWDLIKTWVFRLSLGLYIVSWFDIRSPEKLKPWNLTNVNRSSSGFPHVNNAHFKVSQLRGFHRFNNVPV